MDYLVHIELRQPHTYHDVKLRVIVLTVEVGPSKVTHTFARVLKYGLTDVVERTWSHFPCDLH